MSTPARQIDELDRRIVERLRVNGRETNRSLATALAVNESTIAAHLRRLESDNVVHVVALTDISGFGFAYFAFALLRVRGRSAMEVAADLAGTPEVIAINVMTGRFDVACVILARDRAELGRLVGETIPRVEGVVSVRCELAVDVLRFDSEWAALRVPPAPAAQQPSLQSGAVDELDLAIIGVLQRDARTSNRSIATELDVSEGTVRLRLKRLEDEHLIRIRAVSDIEAFNLGASALVGVHAAGGAVEELGRALVAMQGVAAVVRSVGEFDFILIVLAQTRAELLDTVLQRVQGLPHVSATETFESAATLKHIYTWVRLVDPATSAAGTA